MVNVGVDGSEGACAGVGRGTGPFEGEVLVRGIGPFDEEAVEEGVGPVEELGAGTGGVAPRVASKEQQSRRREVCFIGWLK